MSNERIFSNGPALKDFVINPLSDLISKSSSLCIAAPFVTRTDELVKAAQNGKVVRLIVGLNILRLLHLESSFLIRSFPNYEWRSFPGSGQTVLCPVCGGETSN